MINAPDAIRHVLVGNHENYGRNNAHQARAAAGARQRAAPRGRRSLASPATHRRPGARAAHHARARAPRRAGDGGEGSRARPRRRGPPRRAAPAVAAPGAHGRRPVDVLAGDGGVRRRAARHAAALREGLRAARLPRPASPDLDALAARHPPRRLPCRMAAARGPSDRRAGAAGGARAGRPAARPVRPARRRARPGDRRGLRPGATPRRSGDLDPGRSRDHGGLALLGLLRRFPPAGAPGAHRGRGGRPRPLGGQRRGRAQTAAASPAPSWTRPCGSIRRSS